MSLLRRTCAVLGAALLIATVGALPAAAADPASVTGTACGVGVGVTVVVDFTPTTDAVQLGCAHGAQTSIWAALSAAGFTATAEVTGFGNYLCAINGVAANPVNCQAFPGAYWAGFLNTSDGNPGGPLRQSWTAANVGLDGGPLAVGSVVGYIQNTDGSFPGASPRFNLESLPHDNTPVDPPRYGPAAGSGAAGAAWIGRQLQAGNGLLNGSVGLTVDAIYTLAAAGIGGDQIAASAQLVLDSGASYIGGGTETAAKFGQIAKVALALQIAGLDASDFPDGAGGTRDLLAELRATLKPDGSFGTGDVAFLHAYALLALARTAGGVPASAVSWLEAQQCTDAAGAGFGSYGYGGCDQADPDATAMAIQALLTAGVDPGVDRVANARAWLIGRQAADGGIADNTNSTGLGGQALRALGATDAAAAAGNFIGGLQVTCDLVNAAGSALTSDNVGAIGWKPGSLTDATEFGIDSGNLGQWQVASVQAVFGLGGPPLGSLTAAGAAAELPAAVDCTPPDPSPPSTAVLSTGISTQVSARAVAATSGVTTRTSAPPTLSSTGVSDRTVPELLFALTMVVTGTVLVVAARAGRRRPAGGRHR